MLAFEKSEDHKQSDLSAAAFVAEQHMNRDVKYERVHEYAEFQKRDLRKTEA